MPRNEHPVTAIDQAANKAFEVIDWYLDQRGAAARHIFLIIDATDQPEGEPNATMAARGYEDDSEVLAELLQHAREVGKEMGVSVYVLDSSESTPGQG